MPISSPKGANGRRRSLEAFALFQGAHGVEAKHGLDQVQADFDQKAAKVNHEAVLREKKHEAILDRVRALLPDAERQAAKVNARTGHDMPQVVFPTFAAVAALAIALTEIILLAPALDVLDITTPALQYFAAAGIVLFASMAFHFAYDSFTSGKGAMVPRLMARGIAVLVSFFLVAWGILRGKQVAFAAHLNRNPLGDFLSEHPALGSAFFVFLTLVTPLVVAMAGHYAINHLQDWWAHRVANSKLRRLREAKVTAQKQLDAEREQRRQLLKNLASECAEAKAVYRLHHARGSMHPAQKEPMLSVYLKSVLTAIVAGLAFIWLPPVAVLAALAGGIAGFVYFRHRQEHPDPEKYFREQRVRFASPLQNVTPTKEPLLIEAKVQSKKPGSGILP